MRSPELMFLSPHLKSAPAKVWRKVGCREFNRLAENTEERKSLEKRAGDGTWRDRRTGRFTSKKKPEAPADDIPMAAFVGMELPAPEVEPPTPQK